MVIGKSKQFPKLFVHHHLPEKINLLIQIALTVNDRFVPSFRLLLNPEIPRPHPGGIEAAFPSSRCERRCAKKNSGQKKRALDL